MQKETIKRNDTLHDRLAVFAQDTLQAPDKGGNSDQQQAP